MTHNPVSHYGGNNPLEGEKCNLRLNQIQIYSWINFKVQFSSVFGGQSESVISNFGLSDWSKTCKSNIMTIRSKNHRNHHANQSDDVIIGFAWVVSCATLYLRHVIDAYANYYFWDEMQFWILQFCQTRFWSVTIFRFMMSHHLWVTISDSPLWLILFSSFSTRLCIFFPFLISRCISIRYLRKWQKIFQNATKKRLIWYFLSG